jgi:hypothetical protein
MRDELLLATLASGDPGVAQTEEHPVVNREDVGSNPTSGAPLACILEIRLTVGTAVKVTAG